MEQEVLIKQVIKRKRKAQIEFYRRYFGLLMSFAYKYYNNEEDAAAVVNTAFLKIFDNLHKYDSKFPIEVWMRRITVNHIIDEFRKNKKYKEAFLDTGENHYFSDSVKQEENTYNECVETENVELILKQLPTATKNVFCLYAIDGFSHQEITKMLGISYETSKWHVKEARKKLRRILAIHRNVI